MKPEDDRSPGVHRDPLYLGMRKYRQGVEQRVDIEFADCGLAKLYPRAPAPWRETAPPPQGQATPLAGEPTKYRSCKYCISPRKKPCTSAEESRTCTYITCPF